MIADILSAWMKIASKVKKLQRSFHFWNVLDFHIFRARAVALKDVKSFYV